MDRTEFVYFIRVEAPVDDRPIKIGQARNVEPRRRLLQCSSPWPLVTVRAVPGSFDLERRLHHLLAPSRMCGEWFSPSPLLDGILAMTDEEIRERFSRPPSNSGPQSLADWSRLLGVSEDEAQTVVAATSARYYASMTTLF